MMALPVAVVRDMRGASPPMLQLIPRNSHCRRHLRPCAEFATCTACATMLPALNAPAGEGPQPWQLRQPAIQLPDLLRAARGVVWRVLSDGRMRIIVHRVRTRYGMVGGGAAVRRGGSGQEGRQMITFALQSGSNGNAIYVLSLIHI